MITIKSYTDLDQSKRLAEILPPESADMIYPSDFDFPFVWIEKPKKDKNAIPCWSLAALLDVLPCEVCDDYGDSLFLKIDKEDDVYQLTYIDTYGIADKIYTDRYEHFIDACVDMIEKLHKLNLL